MKCPLSPRIHIFDRYERFIESERNSFGSRYHNLFVVLRGRCDVSERPEPIFRNKGRTSLCNRIVPRGSDIFEFPTLRPAVFAARYTFGYCSASSIAGY